MNPAIACWLFFRLVRWMAWATLLGFSFYFVQDRAPHLTSFGHLLHSTEMIMFGSGLVAVFAGFLELMMRERAGLVRPSFGQLIPPASGAHPSP
jgi:hypothetical protein